MYMATNSSGATLLYGGKQADGSPLSDMWEFSPGGGPWRQIYPTINPGARSGGGLAYDRARDVMVLYGGRNALGEVLNDTWEYSGDWRQVSTPNAPSITDGQSMTYDPLRREVILYGGCGNGDHVWLYDGTNWAEGPSGPPTRNNASLAFNDNSGTSIVFGGSADCGSQLLQDTWEWNGANWTHTVSDSSPTPREGMAMVSLTTGSGVLGFGGAVSGVASADTWLYTTGCHSTGGDCDGDGFAAPADCNDADITAYPGALEQCDGIDNDCDGAMDDSAQCDGTCPYPDIIGRALQLSSEPNTPQVALIWNGHGYGATWVSGSGAYFAQLSASGERLGNDVLLTESGNPSTFVWTGTEYAFARGPNYCGGSTGSQLIRLTAEGQLLSVQPSRLNTTYQILTAPRLTWNGTTFAFMPRYDVTSKHYLQQLDRTGLLLTEVDLGGCTGKISTEDLVWSGSEYGMVQEWFTHGSASLLTFDPDGSARPCVTLNPPIGLSSNLLWTGSEYAFVGRGMNVEGTTYLVQMDTAGARARSDIQAPFSGILAWTGQEYAVFGPGSMTRINPSGTLVETHVVPVGQVRHAVWTGSEFGVLTSTGMFARIGCHCSEDRDGDTFSGCSDCDESRASIHPGAPEYCNSIDDDCDGQIDEQLGQTSCGLGACVRTVDNCISGSSTTCVPGLPSFDTCNGIDDNCNGVVDDGDSDGDGFTVCVDCDDSVASTNPGATETCNAVDDNCNTLIDDDAAGLDSDSDGVHNACDNCRFAYNPTQVDTDRDTLGNSCDNCVFVVNPSQADLDGDQRGDLCDNCPSDANSFQDDTDFDTIGDACDNCILTPNRDQGDVNSDFVGDVCDLNDGLILIRLPDDLTVEWQQESGFEAFNRYRGDLSVLRASGLYTQDPNTVPLAGRECGLADAYSYDFSDPPVGKAVFFLVTGVHLGVEGSLGKNSAGVQRPNGNPCP